LRGVVSAPSDLATFSKPHAPRALQAKGQTHVHDTAVDVAELLQAEQPGTVGRVIEDVALQRRRRVSLCAIAAGKPIQGVPASSWSSRHTVVA